MTIVSTVLITLVAVIHVYIMVLEMLLWTTPRGTRTFGISAEFAEQSRPLAANQGLYNGLLAAGLASSLFAADPVRGPGTVFLLLWVIIAGIFGAATVNKRIIVVQALPGVAALVAFLAAS